MTYDLTGNGKTVLKANYGKYWWNPGADFVFNISANSSAWWQRYAGPMPTTTTAGSQASRAP